jgi:hypothetical protein
MNDLNVTHQISNEKGELVIRTGEAMPLKPWVKIDIAGGINAPFEFLIAKTGNYDGKDAYILYDDESIILILNETDPYKIAKIEGRIVRDSTIKSIGINEAQLDIEDLRNLLKFKPHLFKENERKQMLSELLNLEYRVNTVRKDAKDDKGKVSQSIDINVEDLKILRTFTLNVPLFKNSLPQPFKCNLEIVAVGSGVQFFIYSEEMLTRLENEPKELIAGVLEKISAIFTCSVIRL